MTKDNTSVETYDTIFLIAESPKNKDLIWVGSDDGLVHVTRDGGAHWTNVTPKGMPDFATIQMIEPDPDNPGTACVAADRHRLDDFKPYAFRTQDYGKSWMAITEGLAADAYLHVIRRRLQPAGRRGDQLHLVGADRQAATRQGCRQEGHRQGKA